MNYYILTFIVLLILKATSVVAWSWWIIFSPILVMLALWVVIAALAIWAMCKADSFWG